MRPLFHFLSKYQCKARRVRYLKKILTLDLGDLLCETFGILDDKILKVLTHI